MIVPERMIFSLNKRHIFNPTCCSRLRTPLPWEYAETWCHQKLAWCHQWLRLDSPSPGLRQTLQKWKASPTEKWLRQTLAPQEYRPPTNEKSNLRMNDPMVLYFRRKNRFYFELTTTTSSLRKPRTFPEAYCMENPVPFSMWVWDLEPSYLLWVTMKVKVLLVQFRR